MRLPERDAAEKIRVLRVYHGGRDFHHRARERALSEAGVDVTLAVPRNWPDVSAEPRLSPENFDVVELAVHRAGAINRHTYADRRELRRIIIEARPDVLDIHEEPFSLVARQWLALTPPELPVVMYAAQNVDKRLPPPFAQHERAVHRRVAACYACSKQAASVLRGKGFRGRIDVLPLGYDRELFQPGSQSLDCDEIVLLLVGRLVPEKGVEDCVRTLARLHAVRPARLVLVGEGPAESKARALAASLGVAGHVERRSWQAGFELASTYRKAHVVLIPSRPTATWTEQYGRVINEAQASGAVVAGYASGAIPEVAGKAALLVTLGDVDQLAAEVARLVTNPEEFARRREDGRRQASARGWDTVAARQTALYQAVRQRACTPLSLPASPRRRRARARDEFGETAPTVAGIRPFALPLLRRGGAVPRALGAVIDTTSELLARAGG